MKESWQRTAHELRTAESAGGRARLGRFSVEGLRLVERALRAGAPVERALVAAGLAGRPDARERELLEALRDRGVPVDVAPDAAVDALCGGRGLGRVLALVRGPRPARLADALASAPPLAPVAVLADVEDPGNVGALVRTALAAGAAAAVAAGISDPWHPRALRTSMGSAFRLAIARADSAAEALDALRATGAWTVGAVAEGGTPLPDLAPPGRRPALFLGSEAAGLDPGLAEGLDARVTIPMPPDVDSFSVNAAGAILLYALARR